MAGEFDIASPPALTAAGRDSIVGSVPAPHLEGMGFSSRPGHAIFFGSQLN